MHAAAAVRGTLALVLLTTCAWAAALTVADEPALAGASGDYVTLGFPLVGSGDYEYTVRATEGWSPLSGGGRVTVDGEGYVSVTVRVPRAAPGNSRAEVVVTFVAVDDPGDTATARGSIEVLPTVALEIVAPRDLEGRLGEPFTVSLQVANRGNLPDTVTLSGDGGMWDVRFSANPVRLEAGEEKQVDAVLVPRGQVSSGYRQILRVSVVSGNDPSVSARAAVTTIFTDASSASAADATADPSLTLALRSGVTARLSSEGGDVSGNLSYDVNPRMSGQLSDYVDVSAGLGSLSGSIVDPFARVPSQFDVALAAENWDATASAGNGGYSLAGGGVVSGWRVGGGGNYRSAALGDNFGVNAYAISQSVDLDLQFAGSSAWLPDGRSDILSARYRTRIGDAGLVFSAGSNLSGRLGPGGYVVNLGLDESLSYQTQAIDVTQSYSGVPAAGLHNIGVSGGVRSSGVFGVRASSSLQLSPSTSRWRHGVTLTSRPLQGVGLALAGTLTHEPTNATWTLRPSASFRYGRSGLGGTFSVSYAHTGVIRGDAATSDRYGAAASFRFANLSLSTSASLRSTSATADDPAGHAFSVHFDADYALGITTQVSASFEYEADSVAGEQSSTGDLAWTQAWTADVSSRLSYERSHTLYYDSGLAEREERLALIGQASDLWLQGLDLSAGYALSSRSGLFTGITPLRHDLSVRLAYTLQLSFDTPSTVVDLFGGRRGGEVRGIAFLDRDLDGVKGPGDEFIAGLEMELDGRSVVTAPDGSFRIRTGVGSHEWSFGAGLPGRVKLLNDAPVQVEEDTSQVVNLVFAPVARVPVTLFDDLDGDGFRSEEEGGIAFGGVRFSGPLEFTLRMDARGTGVATGLVPGRYIVTPDADVLPQRFRATTEPVVLEVREGDRPPEIVLGAGAPPREVVTTFTSDSLAVIGRVDNRRIAAGEAIDVSALVSGNAQRVVAILGDIEVELTGQGPLWNARLVVPEGHPPGPAVVVLRAYGKTAGADSEAPAAAIAEVGLEIVAARD